MSPSSVLHLLLNDLEKAGAPQRTAREALRQMEDVQRLEREKSELLSAELVDLQHQAVALQRDLEHERREVGRLRADFAAMEATASDAYAQANSARAIIERIRDHADGRDTNLPPLLWWNRLYDLFPEEG